MPAPKWAVGKQKVGPSMYLDSDGGLHVDMSEICERAGLAPTPENCSMLQGRVHAIFRETFGDVPTEIVMAPPESEAG